MNILSKTFMPNCTVNLIELNVVQTTETPSFQNMDPTQFLKSKHSTAFQCSLALMTPRTPYFLYLQIFSFYLNFKTFTIFTQILLCNGCFSHFKFHILLALHFWPKVTNGRFSLLYASCFLLHFWSIQ